MSLKKYNIYPTFIFFNIPMENLEYSINFLTIQMQIHFQKSRGVRACSFAIGIILFNPEINFSPEQ